jgi:hypothetical protein
LYDVAPETVLHESVGLIAISVVVFDGEASVGAAGTWAPAPIARTIMKIADKYAPLDQKRGMLPPLD